MLKRNKKAISLMLSVAMLVGAFSFTAIAEDAAVSPDADKDIATFIEAEDCDLSGGSYEIVKDKTVSGGKYITTTGSKLEDPDAVEPELLYEFDVKEDATYYVWMRYLVENNGSDSFFIGFNDQKLYNQYGKSLDITGEEWRWVLVCQAELKAGKNSLKMFHREKLMRHDAFYITTDSAFSPSEYKAWLEEYNKQQAAKREAFKIEPIEPINKFGKYGVAFEGESTGSEGVVIKKDADASGGKYMMLRESGGSTVKNPIDYGQPAAVFSLEIPYGSTYYVWARIKAPSDGNDSYFVNMDTLEHQQKNVKVGEDFYWQKIYTAKLTAGIHTLNLIPRENGTQFDKFIVTDNAAYTPTGEGDISKIVYDVRYPEPTITPPPTHPRVYFTSEDIPTIKENLTKPQNEGAYNLLKTLVETDTNEVDGKLADGAWKGKAVFVAEAKAFEYAINGDEQRGREAITIMINFAETVDISKLNYNTAGQLIFSLGEIYDWCYPLMDDAAKSLFHNTVINAASKLEVKYPPTSQGAVVGHGAEGQLMRDLMAAGIAMYDEYPHIYQNAAGRFLTEFVDVRKFVNQAHMGHQGTKYFAYRVQWEMMATLLFDAMGHPDIFGEELQDSIRNFLYVRRGDGYVLADGDGSYHNDNFGYYYKQPSKSLFFAGNYYDDPILKWEAMREIKNMTPSAPTDASSNQDFSCVEFLIFNNPDLDGEPVNRLPLTHYQPSPMGGMIARTGWEDGFDSPAVVAEMRVKEHHFGNHQHLDAGSFQIYYKGALATDDGYYQASRVGATNENSGNTDYGSMHWGNYYRRTIAHNSMLIYDPDEKFLNYESNDGGQRFPNNGTDAYKFEDYMDPVNGYKVGEILGHEFGLDPMEPNYTYLKGDISDAYTDKVENFERSFMFLNLKNEEHPAAMVVFDRVISSNADFKKTWLCHGLFEPEVNGNRTVFTNARNVIGQDSYNGKLTIDTLLPAEISINTVGGEGKEHMVGDVNYFGQWLSGKNEGHGWRVEISPAEANKQDYFLNVLQVGDADGQDALPVSLIETDKVAGVVVADRVVVFGKDRDRTKDAVTFSFEGDGEFEITVADLAAGTWTVTKNGEAVGEAIATADGGVAVFNGGAGEYTLTYANENATRPAVEAIVPNNEVILIRVDGRFIYSDVDPVIMDGRTLVPMRAIFEKLAADVVWDADAATATATKDGREVKITENSKTAYVDGNAVELDVPAQILDGRFVVPVRFVSESFGAEVEWEPYGKIVNVNMK